MFIRKMSILILIYLTSLIVCFLSWSESAIHGMPPHPELKQRIKRGEIEPPLFLINQKEHRAKGIESPIFHPKSPVFPQGTGPSGSFKTLLLLVEFSDKISQVNAGYFDTLVFVDQPKTVRNYYREVSYQDLDIVTLHLPSSLGWYTAPQTNVYYANGQNGFGDYPQNARKLVEDLVDLADPYVDFSQYDNDADGFVDALMVVHAGPGAEYTGNPDDIWSHAWAVSSPRLKDGVYVYSYSMQPEYWISAPDMTPGVFCHELGHIFGLPDLYDYGQDSEGVGGWSLMASGSWNGYLGDSPAHPDAWSRVTLGFVDPIAISSNLMGVNIPAVEESSVIYRLWTNGLPGNQYFLVENRQKIGYDFRLDGAGLLLWHVDEDVSGNDNQWYPGYTSDGHYQVALEQADGLWDLEKNIDDGDAGDPFPGNSNNRSFTPCSVPNSEDYSFTDTYVEVTNISNSASLMTADLKVVLENSSPDTFSLVSPADFDTTVLPLDLDWNDTEDPDSCDTILYSLHYSTSQNFLPVSTSVITDISFSSHSLTSGVLAYQTYFWKVKASDLHAGETWSSQIKRFYLDLYGDMDYDNTVSLQDVIFLIDYLFNDGPAPWQSAAGDVNQDCKISITDAVYLINYLLNSGPAPQKGCA